MSSRMSVRRERKFEGNGKRVALKHTPGGRPNFGVAKIAGQPLEERNLDHRHPPSGVPGFERALCPGGVQFYPAPGLAT